MKKERVIPKKNYFYLLIMILIVVLLTFIIFGINDKYQNRKLEVSYLDGYVNQISLSEVSNVLAEPSSELFILVTKTGDEYIHKLESDLKKIIKKYDLRDNFIFIDYTDSENNLKDLNEALSSDISNIPAIVYIKNGETVKSIDSENDLLNVGDFEKLLDEYEVK